MQICSMPKKNFRWSDSIHNRQNLNPEVLLRHIRNNVHRGFFNWVRLLFRVASRFRLHLST